MRLRLGCKARSVDAVRRTVTMSDADGGNFDLPYDRLILAIGALSVKPPVEGLDLPGVFFLRWMEDGLACLNFLKERSPRSAAVIGSGYIGLETADALTRRGIQVTLIQRSGTLRKTLDPSLSRLVDEELEKHGVRPVQGMTPKGVERSGERLVVLDERNRRVEADMVLVAVGARPNSELAAQAGADLGAAKAVRVNRRMETGFPESTPRATVWRRITEYWKSPCICLWGPRPTSRVGWPGRTPPEAPVNSRGPWGPR